jgi:hypothetical protein
MNLNRLFLFLVLIILGVVIVIAFYYYPSSTSNLLEYLGAGSAIAGIGSFVYAFFQETKNQRVKQEEKQEEKRDKQLEDLENRIEAISKELADRNLAQDKEINTANRDAYLVMQEHQTITAQVFELTKRLNSFQLELSDIKASQAYQSRIAELIKRIDALETVLLTQKAEELKSIAELSRSYQSLLSELKVAKNQKEIILDEIVTKPVE